MPDVEFEPAQSGRAFGAEDRERWVDLLHGPLDDAPYPVVEEAWCLAHRRGVAARQRGGATMFDADQAAAEARRLAELLRQTSFHGADRTSIGFQSAVQSASVQFFRQESAT
jgi:hypothetical protein